MPKTALTARISQPYFSKALLLPSTAVCACSACSMSAPSSYEEAPPAEAKGHPCLRTYSSMLGMRSWRYVSCVRVEVEIVSAAGVYPVHGPTARGSDQVGHLYAISLVIAI